MEHNTETRPDGSESPDTPARPDGSESPDTPAHQPLSVRKRANTEDLKPPKPESDPHSYDAARIRLTKGYCLRRLTAERQPTPRTIYVYSLMLSECNLALMPDGMTLARQKFIQEMEMNVADDMWKTIIVTEAQRQTRDAILELYWLRILADVGDFVGLECTKLRQKARDVLTKSEADLIGSKRDWQGIWASILDAKRTSNTPNTPLTDDEQKNWDTYKSVRRTCEEAGLDYNDVSTCIQGYAERNSKLHSQLDGMLQGKDFAGLATYLHRISQNLLSAAPVEHHELRAELTVYFEKLRARWFHVRPGAADTPGAWWHTEALWEEVQSRQRKEPKTELSASSTPMLASAPKPEPSASSSPMLSPAPKPEPWIKGPSATPKKAKEVQGRNEYLLTQLPPTFQPETWTLPGPQQIPPHRPETSHKRQVSDAQQDEARKRTKAECWARVADGTYSARDLALEVQKFAEREQELRDALAGLAGEKKALEKELDDTTRRMGELVQAIKDVHGESPPDRSELAIRFERQSEDGDAA